jgi:hypothetical protein
VKDKLLNAFIKMYNPFSRVMTEHIENRRRKKTEENLL